METGETLRNSPFFRLPSRAGGLEAPLGREAAIDHWENRLYEAAGPRACVEASPLACLFVSFPSRSLSRGGPVRGDQVARVPSDSDLPSIPLDSTLIPRVLHHLSPFPPPVREYRRATRRGRLLIQASSG